MKVSIIIPVYNVSDYVERCLNSVITQSYTDLECIIVDDCTPDNSTEKCERMITNYNGPIEFRLLHHEKNRGLSAARNTGTYAATGEYIFYLDSDDWISDDCIQRMMEVANQDNCIEMVMGGIERFGDNNHWNPFLPEGIYTSDFIEHACQYKIYTMAWNKLLKLDFIKSHNLFFKEGLLHEDVLWNVQVACFLKKMAAIEDKTYFYRIRKNSIQTNNTKEFHLEHLGKVKTSLISFVFNNGFSTNKILYDYITTDLSTFLCCRKQLASSFYHTFREGPYWTFFEQKKFGTRRRLLVLSLNRYLPKAIGLSYYRLMYNLLLTK